MRIVDVTHGTHSTRTTFSNGQVEFVTHWDALVCDVNAALKELAETGTTAAMEAERVEVHRRMDEWIGNILRTLPLEKQNMFHAEMKELRGKQKTR